MTSRRRIIFSKAQDSSGQSALHKAGCAQVAYGSFLTDSDLSRDAR
jgi:hypothetical protein